MIPLPDRGCLADDPPQFGGGVFAEVALVVEDGEDGLLEGLQVGNAPGHRGQRREIPPQHQESGFGRGGRFGRDGRRPPPRPG